jgi:hypothetical protein
MPALICLFPSKSMTYLGYHCTHCYYIQNSNVEGVKLTDFRAGDLDYFRNFSYFRKDLTITGNDVQRVYYQIIVVSAPYT